MLGVRTHGVYSECFVGVFFNRRWITPSITRVSGSGERRASPGPRRYRRPSSWREDRSQTSREFVVVIIITHIDALARVFCSCERRRRLIIIRGFFFFFYSLLLQKRCVSRDCTHATSSLVFFCRMLISGFYVCLCTPFFWNNEAWINWLKWLFFD